MIWLKLDVTPFRIINGVRPVHCLFSSCSVMLFLAIRRPNTDRGFLIVLGYYRGKVGRSRMNGSDIRLRIQLVNRIFMRNIKSIHWMYLISAKGLVRWIPKIQCIFVANSNGLHLSGLPTSNVNHMRSFLTSSFNLIKRNLLSFLQLNEPNLL